MLCASPAAALGALYVTHLALFLPSYAGLLEGNTILPCSSSHPIAQHGAWHSAKSCLEGERKEERKERWKGIKRTFVLISEVTDRDSGPDTREGFHRRVRNSGAATAMLLQNAAWPSHSDSVALVSSFPVRHGSGTAPAPSLPLRALRGGAPLFFQLGGSFSDLVFHGKVGRVHYIVFLPRRSSSSFI